MPATLHLKVITPDRTIVDRKVKAVSFMGTDGSFGILPQHAPLMTSIDDAGSVRVTNEDGQKEEMFISDGFAQMRNNVLTITCQAGEKAGEIDLERVKAAEAAAREKLKGLDRMSKEAIRAEASLRKALAREMLVRRVR